MAYSLLPQARPPCIWPPFVRLIAAAAMFLHLPPSLHPFPTNAAIAAIAAAVVTAAQATSAALGYLLLLVDQVGLIMGGPMLHESLYQGSTSSIWQPPSFWSRQPRSPAAMLPLHVLCNGGTAGAGAGQSAYASTTNR